MFRSLLQKEWVERRSMLWLGIVFVVGFLGYCIAYEIEYRTRAFVAGIYHTCMIFGQVASLLLAMTTATGEYSQRTIKFSASLPISLSRIGWARLLGAWGCLIGPIIVGAILATCVLGSGFIEQAGLPIELVDLPNRKSMTRIQAIGFLWMTTAVSIAIGLHLVTLLSLLGTRCRSEATVGLIGALVILMEMILMDFRTTLETSGYFWLADWIGSLLPITLFSNGSYGQWDGSSYTDLIPAPLLSGPLVLNLLLTFALGVWFSRCYGRRPEAMPAKTGKRTRWIPALPNPLSWLPVQRHSQASALIWMSARQSVAMGLSGLAVAFLITLSGLQGPQENVSLDHIRGSLPSNTSFVGILWSGIVASSLFAAELKPDLEQFWRSRPIAPGQWFWIKFFVGLIAVVGALDGIPALMAWNSTYQPASGRMGLHYLICFPMVHAQVYAVAVAAICRLKRPIPAVLVAILSFFLLEAILQSIPFPSNVSTIHIFNRMNSNIEAGEKLNLFKEGYFIGFGIFISITAIATILASRKIIPARSSHWGLFVAIALVLTAANTARGDEPITVENIIEGINVRNSVIQDLHLRLNTHIHRSDAFLENEAKNRAADRKLGRRWGSPPVPQDVESVYDVFERLPCRTINTLNSDGTVRSFTAFDGTLLRSFDGLVKNAPGGSMEVTSHTPPLIMLTPHSALSPRFSLELMQIIDDREVDGERLIDLKGTRTIQGIGGKEPESAETSHFQMTVNVSRNFWPIHVREEAVFGSPEILHTVIEATATGWIDAGPMFYPRKIEQITVLPCPIDLRSASTGHPSPTQAELEPFEIKSVEVTEIAVNSGLSDDLFQPAFPVGAAYWDFRDRKPHEIDAQGNVIEYRPLPKGIRGATFTYHIIWMSALFAYLFIRRDVQIDRNRQVAVIQR